MRIETLLNKDSDFNFCFEDKDGNKFYSSIKYEDVKELLEEKAFENLQEEPCNESSCQVNGFCECGSLFDEIDLELKTISIDI